MKDESLIVIVVVAVLGWFALYGVYAWFFLEAVK